MAGVTQQMGVTGNPYLRRNQSAELQARRDMFPSLMQMEMQSEFNEAQIEQGERRLALDRESMLNQQAMQERSFGLEKERQKLAERESDIGTGLAAAKLGVTALNYDFGNLFGGGGASESVDGRYIPATGEPGGFFNTANIGGTIAGGAMGFGAGKLVGGKNKLLQAGAGILAGGATGFLSGGGLSGGLLGGLAGGAGGFLSGLF